MTTSLFLKRYHLDIIAILLLCCLLPLFFFKLGATSLTSFDEAWYGAIAQNIVNRHDLINLYFNNTLYTDHPPTGFWLIATSILIFGKTAFAVRFMSAVLGFGSLVVLYFLGKELFGRVVGFTSAFALASSYWFLFRARSGNLDVFLTFFFILTFYFGFKSLKNTKYLFPLSMSLSLLFLTKSIVPFTIIPALFVLFWGVKKQFIQRLIKPTILMFIIVGGWFAIRITQNANFLSHYFKIGLPGVGQKSSYLDNIKLTKEYLHNGIGKWFWPGALSSFVSLITFQKRFVVFGIFFVSFLIPFVFSQKGHIWHLIPIHPFMILQFFAISYVVIEKFSTKFIASTCIVILCLYISTNQMRRMWYEFIDIPAYTSDEEILSRESAQYDGMLYVDGDFVQAASFYSEKQIKQVHSDELRNLFPSDSSFTLITTENRLQSYDISESDYTIIKKDRDKVLVVPNN